MQRYQQPEQHVEELVHCQRRVVDVCYTTHVREQGEDAEYAQVGRYFAGHFVLVPDVYIEDVSWKGTY